MSDIDYEDDGVDYARAKLLLDVIAAGANHGPDAASIVGEARLELLAINKDAYDTANARADTRRAEEAAAQPRGAELADAEPEPEPEVEDDPKPTTLRRR